MRQILGDAGYRSPVNAAPVHAPAANRINATNTGSNNPGGKNANGRYTDTGLNSELVIECSGV
ncbi:hypothetical protein [Nocardia sp. NPDC050710]|uniref:hypothetical protein n=1 Tax=Nocardia sp. NPDC050710 TaxID=3157220 RepID=UPI0033E92BAB